MAETADDLSTPLGQETVARRKRRFRLPFTGTQALAVLLGLFLVAFVGFAIFNDNPLGGEPIARVAIRPPAAPAGEKMAAAPAAVPEQGAKSAPKQAAAPGEQKTVTIIDGSSGARHDFVLSGDAAHFKDNWDNKRVASMNTSADQTLASYKKIADTMAQKKAALWINHDLPQSQGQKHAPQFYD